MKVDVKKHEDKSQAELVISVPPEEFKPHIKKAAEKLSKEHPLQGFRPGKAPAEAVAEHLGTERLLREAMEPALAQFFVRAAVEYDIEAINRPNISIEELTMDGPLKFTARVDVLPNVTIGDPTKLKAEKKSVSAEDAKVEEEIRYLAKMRSSTIAVARPAAKGDVVKVDFTVRLGGKVIEGGESKNHPVVLGEGKFVPDFENNITGMEAGDTRQFAMKFPDDYPNEELQGRTTDVVVTAHSVEKQVLPEVNDDFAKSLGAFTDLKDLKTKLKQNITDEMEHKEQERYLGELAEQLAESSTFTPIPDVLIENEINSRLSELQNMLAMQQTSLEAYLQREKKTIDEMRAGMRESAVKHIKVGLMLRRMAEQYDISVEDAEIEAEVIKQMEHFGNIEKAKEQIDPQELRDHVTARLRNRKTLDKLAELAEGKDEKLENRN